MIYIAKDISKNALVHYGTKNMKWGVRKYQNEDGTLTEAGKKRYRDKLPSSAAKAAIDENDVQALNPNKYSKITRYETLKTNLGKYVQRYDQLANAKDAYKIRQLINGGASKEALNEAAARYGGGKVANLNAMAGGTIADEEEKKKKQSEYIPTSAIKARNETKEDEKNRQKQKNAMPTSAYQSMMNGSKKAATVVKKVSGMPTSAITAKKKAENDALVKSKIPTSAWNQRINNQPQKHSIKSKEYLDNLKFNSQKNSYFGKTY